MIRAHEFNSDWSGRAAGILTDLEFLDASTERIRDELEAWDWVEARAPVAPEVGARLARAGFVQLDTQLPFKIGLTRLEGTPSLERVSAEFADEAPFELGEDDAADFEHERFSALRGVTRRDLNRRYHLWAGALLAEDPAHCLRVLAEGEVQGWFLGRTTPKGLELTLAMLHRDACISGHLLYHRALTAYRARGARMGFAAFSVTNTAVHNIYAALGARFLAPEGCWLWQRGGL